MFRRRRRDQESAGDPPGDEPAEAAASGAAPGATTPGATPGATGSPPPAPGDDELEPVSPKSDRPEGPWDASEVDLDDPGRVDLGALRVRGVEGMALQLQVEEGSQRVQAALVVLDDAAVQLLAVAAPRSSGLWDESRSEMGADARARGGSAEEAEGPFGPELRVVIPVTLPDGSAAVQPSRVSGIDGPRWLLRATFLGRAALEEEPYARLASVVRDVVVVRGDGPMAPGDLLELRLPPDAVPAAGPGAGGDADAPPARPTLEDLDPGPTITEIR